MRKLLCVFMLVLVMGHVQGALTNHWRLDEGSGVMAYNSAGYVSGTVEGTTYSWQPAEGMGGGIYFGRDDRIKTPAIDIGLDWTVMGWIKPDTQVWTQFSRLMISRHTNGFFVGMTNQNPPRWSLIVNLSHGGKQYNGPAYSPGVWQHVAATYDSAARVMTLYVNGVGNSVGDCAAPISPNQVIYIGTDRLNNNPAVLGIYDDFAIYDRALSTSEINAIYQEGLAGKAINYWQAKNPSPSIGSVGQPLDVALNWSAGSNPPAPITSHILYWGTNPQAVFDSNSINETAGDTLAVSLPFDTTSYAPGFSYDKTIYWRVDQKIDDPNIVRGGIWSFETVRQTPIITQQPTNVRVFANESATFSVTATSASALSYQWYKEGSGSISGATSEILVIENVSEVDEGQYYVEVTNLAGTVTSNSAALILKRLLGHWPLDGDPNDVSGYGNHGVPMNGVSFVSGYVGSGAARFQAAASQYIDVPNESHFDTYDAFTMSLFMKAIEPGQNQWATMFAKGGNNGGMYVHRYQTTEFAAFALDHNPDTSNNDTTRYVAFKPVFDDNWHMVTAAFDGAQIYIYIDGVLSKKDYFTQPAAVANDIPLSIGSFRNQTSPASFYNGLLADVRFYNYALSAEEVAQLYYDATGEPVCVTPPAGDLDGNCIVDINDFVKMAREWLECSLYPVGCP